VELAEAAEIERQLAESAAAGAAERESVVSARATRARKRAQEEQ